MPEIDLDYIGPDTYSNSGENRSPSPAQFPFAEPSQLYASDDVGKVAVYFSGAGLVYKVGATFISQFNADPYSTYWQINVFYPFSGLDDWKMANFLLTSKLSMSALDKFLSLEVVSDVLPVDTILIQHLLRQKRCRCHFGLQKISVHGLNFSHQAHDGTSGLFPLHICQNIWVLHGKLTRLIILVITFDILMSYLQINILCSYPAISSRLDLVRTHPSFVVTRSNMVCEF